MSVLSQHHAATTLKKYKRTAQISINTSHVPGIMQQNQWFAEAELRKQFGKL